jgi:glycosyltransferase involved in cell wall biosynthesis
MLEREPIRVAQVIGKMWAGGVETVVFNYYRALDHEKIQFDFYYDEDSTVEPPRDIIDMGARFFMLPPYQKIWKYIPELRRHLKEEKYTIVHSHLNTLSIFSLFAAWSAGVPIRIAHNHSVPGGNEWKRNCLKRFLKRFSKIFASDYFACSEKAGRWMFGDKTFDAGKVCVVKNAIDWNLFTTNERDLCLLKTKFHLEGKFVIGHVGRLTYAKNHIFMVDVLEEVLKKEKNAVLFLVGGGDLYNAIASYVKFKHLEEKVIFAGQVANPQDYYQLIDVMIVPSRFEGLSLTTIEGQISGIPVVISEAVPDEAIISNACHKIRLSTSKEKWADIVIQSKGENVSLDERSKEYDIRVASVRLTEWYLRRWKSIRQKNV